MSTVPVRTSSVRPSWETLEDRLLLSSYVLNGPLDVNGIVEAGMAQVTASTYDIGEPANLFDGDTESLYRSAAVNPAWIQVSFDNAKTLSEFQVYCCGAWGDPAYQWSVEIADNQADMDSQTGSYAEVVSATGTPSDVFSVVTLGAPVTAQLVRLQAERLTGDDYVHVNEWVLVGETELVELAVEPDDDVLEEFSIRQYHAWAIDSDGISADYTDQVDWFSTDDEVATVDPAGMVTAAGPGFCEILADFGPLQGVGTLEVAPYELQQVDLDVTLIERTPRYDFDATKNNPAPGETVTFHGHVCNWGNHTSSAAYRWELDGQTVTSGTLTDLVPDQEVVLTQDWAWEDGEHTVRLVVDPDDEIDESSEANNSRIDRTDALSVGFWVEQSLYDYFHEYQQDLGIGSNSWEDWAQRQMAHWNEYSAGAIHPTSPQGVLDRVRIDKITVVPDGALPLNGGLPTNHPDLSDKTVDLTWGFTIDGLSGSFYANHTDTVEGNAFYLEESLIHEMGHARYLIDNYGFDVHDGQVDIYEGGQPVAGSAMMPFIAWDSVLYYNQYGGVMTGPWRGWSPYEAAAFNLIAGNRASEGNCNAPGNIGVFLNDLPQNNHLQLVDLDGYPMDGATVDVYQAVAGPGWYGKYIDNTPDLSLIADGAGYVHLPRNPFAAGDLEHTYGIANGVAVLRIEHGPDIWYRFLEAPTLNMEYWKGNTQDAYYTLELPWMGYGPEPKIEGYGQEILDGDTTPSLADHTDFGSSDVGQAGATRQFVVRNRGDESLYLDWPRVEITGPDAGDFTLFHDPGDHVNAGAIGTFDIGFIPGAEGLRTAVVEVSFLDYGPFVFTIQGEGAITAPIPGDANGDGHVTDADYTIWADNYGQPGGLQQGDFNNDGQVTDADYTLWADHYGQQASASVPLQTAVGASAPADQVSELDVDSILTDLDPLMI
jgi:CARDB protein/F5/8 type C domain-containing protein